MKKDTKKKKLSNVGIAIITAIVVIIIFIILFLTTKYDVAFNTMGGSNVPSQTVNVFGQVQRPADPIRDGYTFENWYYDGGVFDFSTRITSNMILEARWIDGSPVIEYTVSFNSTGGSNVASVKVNANSTLTKPEDPTRTGYTFKGWQYNGKDFDFSTKINSNITLVAVWTEGSSTTENPTNTNKPTNSTTTTSKPSGSTGSNSGSSSNGSTTNPGTTNPGTSNPGTTNPEPTPEPVITYAAVCEAIPTSMLNQCELKIQKLSDGSFVSYVSGTVTFRNGSGVQVTMNTGDKPVMSEVNGLAVASHN